ncbi:unnamed protein product [Dibothriocephalus latus]|uniref:Uncharacterized protein n=1 Tax=Dibothriocephalus latus TaxID=60516 RepID=A0A3P6P3F4_DIBLA|nr:unnamed protein product [Dibothriocephalus latus]
MALVSPKFGTKYSKDKSFFAKMPKEDLGPMAGHLDGEVHTDTKTLLETLTVLQYSVDELYDGLGRVNPEVSYKCPYLRSNILDNSRITTNTMYFCAGFSF